MITYVKGNLFESPAQILVNTVNTVGVMGKGIALEFKNKYPEMFAAYKELCAQHKLQIGSLYLWKKSNKWVLLFPTKKNWRNPSELSFIEQGLQTFVKNWDKLGMDSIAFPKLGCGNGGLNWEQVQPLMEKYLKHLPMRIYIYVDAYNISKPEHQNGEEMKRWLDNEMAGFDQFSYEIHELLKAKNGILMRDKFQCTLDGKNQILINGNPVLEEEIFRFWEYVCNVGIAIIKEIPFEFQNIATPFFALMEQLQYVSQVIVSKDGKQFPQTPNAYQYVKV